MEINISNAGLAAVFSFIFNGLGQLYNGHILKGLAIIFLSAVSMLTFIIGATFLGLWLVGKPTFPGQIIFGLVSFSIGLVFICILGIYSILDAYRVASKPFHTS